MKVSHLRWLFIAMLALLLALGLLFSERPPRTYGVSVDWADGRYRFAGGTSPLALIFAAAFVLLYLLLMRAVPTELGNPLPGLFRRFVAFWLDFVLAMVAIGPILGLLPMVVEWGRTRVFQWSIERSVPVPGDVLQATVSALLAFVVLLFYYAWPLVHRRPSPGACILNYQIVPDEGEALTLRMAVLRTLLGFAAVASFPLALFIDRDRKKGQFWLDKVFSTRAWFLRQA